MSVSVSSVASQSSSQEPPVGNVSFETLVPLRWGDMDARQHLNNTLYFRLMEEGRIQAFHRFGSGEAPGNGIILASISCDFLRPLTYPSTARVIHRVNRIGRSSLNLDVRIERADEPGVPYAQGREVVVWVNHDSGKSEPWPPSLLHHLRGQT